MLRISVVNSDEAEHILNPVYTVSAMQKTKQKHLMTPLNLTFLLSILINSSSIISRRLPFSSKSNVPDRNLQGLNFSVHSLERASDEAIKTPEPDGADML